MSGRVRWISALAGLLVATSLSCRTPPPAPLGSADTPAAAPAADPDPPSRWRPGDPLGETRHALLVLRPDPGTEPSIIVVEPDSTVRFAFRIFDLEGETSRSPGAAYPGPGDSAPR